MKLIKLFSYVFLAIIVSAVFAIVSGRCYLSILSRPGKINREALPPFFLVVAFSPGTGKAELVKLYEYSAHLKQVTAEFGSSREELLRNYGPIVFEEDKNKWSYSIDPPQREKIEDALDLDIRFPNVERVEIKLLSNQKSTGGQRIALYAGSDENDHDFIYEVSNGYVTPLAYGNVTRRKIWLSIQLQDRVFLLSMSAFVLWQVFRAIRKRWQLPF